MVSDNEILLYNMTAKAHGPLLYIKKQKQKKPPNLKGKYVY